MRVREFGAGGGRRGGQGAAERKRTGGPSSLAVGKAHLKGTGAGEGNLTLVFSLEGCCSTIELHPHEGDSMPICAALGNGRADNAFPI